MPLCPSCESPLDQDFGMVTCGGCGAVLMININGHVVIGGDTSPEAAISESDFEDDQNADSLSAEPDSANFGWDQDPDVSDSEEEQENFEEEFLADMDPQPSTSAPDPYEEALSEPEIEPDLDPETEVPEVNNAFFEDSEVFDSETDEQVGSDEEEHFDEQNMGIAATPDKKPLDVTEFANSEESSLEGGEFLYEIRVSGLDSKDLRDILKAVLMDEKLKLNYNGIMKQISQGQVKIEGLNPVKAKRIVEQLQYFDLKLKWRQSRVTVEPRTEDNSEEVNHDL